MLHSFRFVSFRFVSFRFFVSVQCSVRPSASWQIREWKIFEKILFRVMCGREIRYSKIGKERG